MAEKKEDFDIYTKGPGSPSKSSKRFKSYVDPVAPKMSGKFEDTDLLPENMNQKIVDNDKAN